MKFQQNQSIAILAIYNFLRSGVRVLELSDVGATGPYNTYSLFIIEYGSICRFPRPCACGPPLRAPEATRERPGSSLAAGRTSCSLSRPF